MDAGYEAESEEGSDVGGIDRIVNDWMYVGG